MKNPLLKASFAALSAIFLLASCDTNEPEPAPEPAPKDLELAMQEFSLTYLSGQSYAVWLDVVSGNGDYVVEVDNESVLTAEAGTEGYSSGKIIITPLKLGKTGITVTDTVTGQDARVEVSVIDSYLRISLSNSPDIIMDIDDPELKAEIEAKVLSGMTLPDDYCYSLINDGGNTLFVYKSSLDYYNGKYSATGTYTFEIDESKGNYAKFTLTDAGNTDGSPVTLYLAHLSLSGNLNSFFAAGKIVPEEGSRAYFNPSPSFLWVQDLTAALSADYPSLKACVAHYYVSGAYDIPAVAPYLTNTPLTE